MRQRQDSDRPGENDNDNNRPGSSRGRGCGRPRQRGMVSQRRLEPASDRQNCDNNGDNDDNDNPGPSGVNDRDRSRSPQSNEHSCRERGGRIRHQSNRSRQDHKRESRRDFRLQKARQSQEQHQQVVEARRVRRRILNSKVCHGDATRSEEILRGSFVVVSLEYSDDTIGEMTVILSVIMKQIWQNFMQLRTSSKLG